MTGSANDVALGKHLETFANKAKQYVLTELLTLVTAINAELAQDAFTDDDLTYIFTDYSALSNSDINYIFSEQGDGTNPFSNDDLTSIFSNQGSAPDAFSSAEVTYIFS